MTDLTRRIIQILERQQVELEGGTFPRILGIATTAEAIREVVAESLRKDVRDTLWAHLAVGFDRNEKPYVANVSKAALAIVDLISGKELR